MASWALHFISSPQCHRSRAFDRNFAIKNGGVAQNFEIHFNYNRKAVDYPNLELSHNIFDFRFNSRFGDWPAIWKQWFLIFIKERADGWKPGAYLETSFEECKILLRFQNWWPFVRSSIPAQGVLSTMSIKTRTLVCQK